MNIHINIRERVAEVQGDPVIICGNSDIAVYFDFDAEWAAYPIRTARFEFWKNGIYLHHDVVFTGTALMAPPFYDIGEVAIGVYASNIKTTTPARVPCSPCILDDSPAHDDPPLDVYDQLLETLQGMSPSGAAKPSVASLKTRAVKKCVCGVFTFAEVE